MSQSYSNTRQAKTSGWMNVKRACVAGALALIVLFLLWYTRPRTWAEITGEDADMLFARLAMDDIDWDAETAMEKLGFKYWQISQDDPRREETGDELLQVLKRYTFRASLSSLIPRDGISMGSSNILTTAVAWGDDSSRLFYFGENGKMTSPGGWGYDIYHCDPALFDELVEIVQTYGAPEEARG